MAMSGLSTELLRDRRGATALEFALALPLFLLLLVGIYEFGSYLSQASSLEKSLRAGAMYAARQSLPLTSQKETEVRNIVRTGDRSGQQPLRIAAWSDPTATFEITTRAHDADGEEINLIKLEASLPYRPLMTGFLAHLGITDMRMRATHEQAQIGF